MRRKPNNGKMHNNGRRRFNNRGGENNAGKIKNVSANRDKYLNLARDAMAAGDRVEAENYLQHAEHYFRVLSALQEEDNRNRPERNDDQNTAEANASGDDSDNRGNKADDADGSDDSDDSLAMAS